MPQKWHCVLTKITKHVLFSKILLHKIPIVTSYSVKYVVFPAGAFDDIMISEYLKS